MGRKPLGPWVVVGVDGSAEASAAVDVAAAEAAARGLRLRIIATCPRPGGPDSYANGMAPAAAGATSAANGGIAARPGMTPGDGPALGVPAGVRTLAAPGARAWAGRAEANRSVAEAAGRVHMAWRDLTVRTLVAFGDPAEALIAESRHAALVVVGARGQGGGTSPGPVCQRVAAHAYCPTMVVPSGVDSTSGATSGASVLVGVEASGRDERALAFAFDEAALRRAGLTVVHVWSGVPEAGLGCVDPFAYDLRAASDVAERRLAETLAGWTDKYPQVPVRRLALYDVNTAQALLHVAAGAGLVVVGASLQASVSGQLLGSVTRTLIQQAPCPVCVVRLTR